MESTNLFYVNPNPADSSPLTREQFIAFARSAWKNYDPAPEQLIILDDRVRDALKATCTCKWPDGFLEHLGLRCAFLYFEKREALRFLTTPSFVG